MIQIFAAVSDFARHRYEDRTIFALGILILIATVALWLKRRGK